MRPLKSTRGHRPKLWMAFCLLLLLGLSVFAGSKLQAFFMANPFFNSLILGVLLIGIVHALREVLAVDHEALWLQAYKEGRRGMGRPSKLLGLMDLWFQEDSRKGGLSPLGQKALLDSVSLRLDEARDLLRYLSGLSIFLGLLGTFWGLLLTIGSVTDIIGALRVEGDAVAMFSDLKEQIRIPLGGMATSFSTSLFGLSSSLVIGFLDLQTGQAQNHFLVDFETFLMSEVKEERPTPRMVSQPLASSHLEALLEKTAGTLERMEQALLLEDQQRRQGQQAIVVLQQEVGRLGDAILRGRSDLEGLREVLEALKRGLVPLSDLQREGLSIPESLLSELRLLTRTVALALESPSRKSP